MLSLKQSADLLLAAKASAVELTTEALVRAKDSQATINAFISIDEEGALVAAKRADALRSAGEATAITGVPIAFKDNFCVKGGLTTCASKMLANFVAPYDATLVERSNAAGLVSIGKLNMDEFAMGSSTEKSFYGATKNPWDHSKVPGGSSGGAAAAIAAGVVAGSFGTDTGGSIRQPASYCGVTGLKPSYGRVSRYGMVAFASSFDQGGPLGGSAEDCALLLSAVAGHDPRDSTSAPVAVDDYVKGLNDGVAGKRIGLPKQYFTEALDAGVRAKVMAAIEVLKSQGAQIVELDLPNQALALSAYYVIAPAEASSNLSRFDGVRFGHRAEGVNDLETLYRQSRDEGFGDEVKRRIIVGTYVLSEGYFDAYFRKAQQLRRMIFDEFTEAFTKVDFIAGPTTPTTAFALGAKSNDPVSMYLDDIYTITANLAGIPGLSLPCGFDQGMPVGLQLLGRPFAERDLLAAGHAYQLNSHWHTAKPQGVN